MNVVNHDGERQSVLLNPGEMLFYESAKIPHGRQFPFDGEYFDNLFIHFLPLQMKDHLPKKLSINDIII